LHLADQATRASGWIAAIVAAVPPIIAGRLTKTDAFTFALAFGTLIFVATKLRIWASDYRSKSTLRLRLAVISAITLPLLLASVAPVALSTVDINVLGKGLLKGAGKEAAHEADLRLELWHEAISRGLQAGGLGLGPGPHLQIPSSIVAARQTETIDTGDHPQVNGTPNFETHNTFFDLFVQGGAIAFLSFVWLTGMGFVTAYKARKAGLMAVLSSLTVFAFLDLVVRDPAFWFGMVLCLTATRTLPIPSYRRGKPPGA
jgi:hypothetical protein